MSINRRGGGKGARARRLASLPGRREHDGHATGRTASPPKMTDSERPPTAGAPPSDIVESTGLRRRTGWLAAAAGFAVLLAIAAGVLALRPDPKTVEAEEAARLALSRQLVAQSINQLDSNNDLAWLLAIEAGRRAETVDTFGALREAFAHQGRTLAIMSGHIDWVNQAAWDADGNRVLTASNDGTARMWDAASGTELAVLIGHTDWVNQAAWNGGGSRVVTASDDGTARIWDVDCPHGR